ncbi:DUF262 domain-containing protein [Helicobacter heilmannii]|uniref:GmrSD restriction endonucleases N-terminal domain-containing protein n=1 Tax=Helicobacter heilmannii TaxID=35817 RepID=A0A0K2XKF8_HELHE|nr:DUF262 domain-containing protein [Helicobacter heilmannii]CCM10846.1 hypothetical protein BN341_11290 [Helicobacter heilmannii ASB1.4]CRF46988.1 hypothetical protein HHE02_02710 [Helicobacter heilmannii]CRI34539.1 hypothetical protein HHE01_03400 [Helicobacter heilmannii]BDQ26633.1 hypothetical protein ASB1_03090 [Helicobacter heilmannii]GMB94636.1 hypothetical protein NHP21011_07290 [Helicobacter heilmannii]
MERMNFLDFLNHSPNIEVPMLQRDYAQGRQSKESRNIANRFLDALFEVIEFEVKKGHEKDAKDKKSALHLDLIYGYIDQDGDREVFKLIDGQQRITTLWLLHFLLFRQAMCLDVIKPQLTKFTYHTRQSSKEFCEELLTKSDSFATNKLPSDAISAQSGFFVQMMTLKTTPPLKPWSAPSIAYIHAYLTLKTRIG